MGIQPSKKRAERELTRTLAEAIILQAIEDIWHPRTRKESMEFFMGEGFTDCADMIGMTLYERERVLDFVHLAYRSMILIPKRNPSPFKVAYRYFPHRQN